VVVTDMVDDDDTPDMYADRIRLWLQRGLPLICANPDKVVERGDRVIYCAGALADLYAEAGGEVLMAGKPYAPIYEDALRLAAEAAGRPIARDRTLAIGDSARTDATGAATLGLDFLFIAGPIHAADFGGSGASAQGVRDLLAPTGARLAGYMPRLAW
jgi:HAD superfamily hydrolase (TIGR01459 family)